MRRTKIRTKLLYVQTGVPLWIVQVPLLALFKLRIRLSPPPNRKGLGILDFASEPRDGAFFGDLVAAGLEIAERLDPKRFERIQKHIRFVISMKRITIANYWRLGRCCSIDLNRCIFRRGSEYLNKEIACILIHESTHGVIEELRIPYTAQNKF